MQTTIDTEISAVTVYSSQAQITRKGTVQLSDSERELIVTDLPMTLQTDSVRVSGTSDQDIQLLGVRTESLASLESTAPEVSDLEAQIKKLNRQQRRYQDQLAAAKLKLNTVEALSEKSISTLSKQIVKEQKLAETQTLLEFWGQQYETYADAVTRIEGQQEILQEQLQILQNQLQKLQTRRPHERYQVVIKIAAAAAGSLEIEMTYRVHQAQWRPLYDLQFNTQTDLLTLAYLAEVEQTTGEAWDGVALALSTAKPGLGSLPPKLEPWFINLPAVERLQRRKSAPPAAASAMAMEAVEDLKMSAPSPRSATMKKKAEVATADISKSGTVVSFQIGGQSNIPSDGNPHTVTLVTKDYPVDCQHIAMPSRVSFAYLQATIQNPTNGITLLPGKANILRDRTFVGTVQLDHIAPGQEFKTDLGIDEGLGIERELIERQVDKKLIGGQRRITFAYRLIVTNFLDQVVKLKLTEQLPLSRDERLKVRLTQSQPKTELGELGQLEWSLALDPQQRQVIEYHFTVEHPPSESVLGLDI